MLESSNNNGNYLIINENAQLGIGKRPLVEIDISGSIQFTDYINNISYQTLDYLDGVTSPIQTQFINSTIHHEKGSFIQNRRCTVASCPRPRGNALPLY